MAVNYQFYGDNDKVQVVPVQIVDINGNLLVTATAPKGFSASATKSTIGLTELNAFFLKNPSASGKTLIVKKLILGNIHTVLGSWVRFRVYSNPTTSSDGSAISEIALAIGSANTTVGTAFTTPVSSANGNLLIDTTTTGGLATTLEFDRQFTIAANNTILITTIADGTSRIANITVIWEEE